MLFLSPLHMYDMWSNIETKFSFSFTLPPWHQPVTLENHRDKEELYKEELPVCPAPHLPTNEDYTCGFS